MTVKVKRRVQEFGQEYETTIYLPEDALLTREERERADRLDEILQKKTKTINEKFDSLGIEIRRNEIKKWRWLGKEIDDLLGEVKEIQQRDIDRNLIWPAIGQYLREELRRGYEDEKRSGTKKDHYRKCWSLATLPGTKWITSWVGWDAFTDRGEQLAQSKKLLPRMEKKFSNIDPPLNSNDFKLIAKLLVKHIPTKEKKPVDIEGMTGGDLKKVVGLVYKEFTKLRSDKRS